MSDHDPESSLTWGLDPLFWVNVKVLSHHLYALEPSAIVKNVYFLYQHPIQKVQLVGIITAIELSEARIQYTVDDAAGDKIVCVQWLNNRDDARSQHTLGQRPSLGQLVAVYGRPTEYRAQRQVSIQRIEWLADENMEMLHWLEVIRLEREVYRQPPRVPQEIRTQQRQIEDQMWKRVRQSGQPADGGRDHTASSDIIDTISGQTEWDQWGAIERACDAEAMVAAIRLCLEELNATSDGASILRKTLQQDTRLVSLVERITKHTSTPPAQLWDSAIVRMLQQGLAYRHSKGPEAFVYINPSNNLASTVLTELRAATQMLRIGQAGVRSDYILSMTKRDKRFTKVSKHLISQALDCLEKQGEVYQVAWGLYKTI